MELKCKLVQLLPMQTGQGKTGTEWKKQDIIVESEGQYPKKVCIAVWGDKINMSHFAIGATINVHFDVESREFNSKWYTDCKAWKIEGAQAGGNTGGGYNSGSAASGFGNSNAAPAPSFNTNTAPPTSSNEGSDDLPF
jgi:hypothetical protein